MKLRPYQKDCVDASQRDRQLGFRKQLAVVGVAGGKSVIIAHATKQILDEHPDGRVIIIIHRKELIDQNFDKLVKAYPDLTPTIGKEKAEAHCTPGTRIMVASNMTVGREGLQRIKQWCPDLAKVCAIIVDEAHHVPGSKTYTTVINDVLAANPHCHIIGFTGTPKRADGERLDAIFEKVVYQIDLYGLWKLKYIASIRGWKIRTNIDLGQLQTHRRDFDDAELEKAVNREERNRMAIELYAKKHPGERALFFCVGKAHAKDLLILARAAGIPAALVTEDTPADERRAIVQEFRAGKLHALMNCQIFTEGFDAPELKAIFVLRPTKSPVLLTQIIGRGIRLVCHKNPADPDGEWLVDWNKKTHCDIYDFVDLKAEAIGAQTISSVSGLRNDFDLAGQDIFETKQLIDSEVRKHPLLAAAILNAKSQAEIDQILQPHDFLSELSLINYASSAITDLNWIQANDEWWLQLAKGELVKLRKSPLGNYELATPQINLASRRPPLTLPVPQPPSPNPPQFLPEQIHALAEDQINDAIHAASNIIKTIVPEDIRLISRNAAWRQRGTSEPSTSGQINMLRRMKIPEPTLRTLNKSQAAEIIDKYKMRQRMLDHQGILAAGKYANVPAMLVAIFDPTYLRFAKTLDKLYAGNPEAFRQAEEDSPLKWLKAQKPDLYQTCFAAKELMIDCTLTLDRNKALDLIQNLWKHSNDKSWHDLQRH